MDTKFVRFLGHLSYKLKQRKKPFCLFKSHSKTDSLLAVTVKNKQLFLLSVKEQADSELIQNYVVHACSSSLAELYERYSAKILGTCFLYLKDWKDAQDAGMEIFEKIILKLSESQPKYFSGWVYAVSRNHCLETIRKRKMQYASLDRVDSFWLEKLDLPADDSEVDLDAEEATDSQIVASLAQLSEAQQLCIKLFYFQEKSYKEIAKKTGMTEKIVKSHLQNGKRNLKNLLSPWYKNVKFA